MSCDEVLETMLVIAVNELHFWMHSFWKAVISFPSIYLYAIDFLGNIYDKVWLLDWQTCDFLVSKPLQVQVMVVSMLGVFEAGKKYDNDNSVFPVINTVYAPSNTQIMFMICPGHKLAQYWKWTSCYQMGSRKPHVCNWFFWTIILDTGFV